jgi:hypothetical protein
MLITNTFVFVTGITSVFIIAFLVLIPEILDSIIAAVKEWEELTK